jgi:hypothetical protein
MVRQMMMLLVQELCLNISKYVHYLFMNVLHIGCTGIGRACFMLRFNVEIFLARRVLQQHSVHITASNIINAIAATATAIANAIHD